jgi:eukaryotic-like serine/threonine-protein kinase
MHSERLEGDLFQPGTLLAGRFHIVRELGHGGMGRVYEAVDVQLSRRVALKCPKPGHWRRLPPEVQAAREVSHFNVCKVHDLHTASTPSADIQFPSMEFIDGETLSARIARDGPLPPAETREIAAQICAGLAQAHRQGVIHGDLKCANIILARSPEGSVRAVITDFGLARFAADDPATGARGGTLDYMAPELMLGAHATAASDIYALGVLLHVMLTGHSPERLQASAARGTAESQAITKTLDSVIFETAWRRGIADLPSPWAKVIARCLSSRPEDRFRSAAAVNAALHPRRTLLKWSVAAASVVAAIALGYWRLTPQVPVTPMRLAVLPFSVEGGPVPGAEAVAMDITERLSGARRKFSVISPREIERAHVDSPQKAKTVLGATHVLQTYLRASGGKVAAQASVSDLQLGRILGQLNASYPAGDAPALAKALLATVTGALRLPAGSPKESVSPAAYPFYTQAIDLMRQDGYNAAKAIPLFEKAIELDPRSALTYAGLAAAQIEIFSKEGGGNWLDLAGSNVLRAKAINSDSIPVLLASGALERRHGSYEAAIRDFTRVTELDPANSEGWLRLATAYSESNHGDEAIVAYRKAVEAQPAYYRTYLELGNYYFFRNDFRQAEENYRRVTTLAPDQETGYMDLGLVLMQRGEFQQAETALLHALRLRKSARLLMNIGALYYQQERYSEAVQYFEQSMGFGTPTALRYRDVGDAYRHLGRKREAVSAYKAARDLAQAEVNRNPRQSGSRILLALMLAHLENPAAAESEASQALSMDPENAMVLREAAITYETLRNRKKSLAILRHAPAYLLQELNRQPDMKALRQDVQFQQLMYKQSN